MADGGVTSDAAAAADAAASASTSRGKTSDETTNLNGHDTEMGDADALASAAVDTSGASTAAGASPVAGSGSLLLVRVTYRGKETVVSVAPDATVAHLGIALELATAGLFVNLQLINFLPVVAVCRRSSPVVPEPRNPL